MTTLREAAQQALEALEDHAQQYPHMQKGYTVDAITTLRAALNELEQENQLNSPVGSNVNVLWGFADINPHATIAVTCIDPDFPDWTGEK